MIRWLAGSFDPSGRGGSTRLAMALADHDPSSVEHGPLRLAYSGPHSQSSGPLCLLDGHIDNLSTLAATLDLRPQPGPEQLLAAAWRRWRHELLSRLRGDFALLIWDTEQGEGLLARDQLGTRSMFLHERDGGLCFANEIRPLLELLDRRPSPDPLGLAHWLAGTGRPGPDTLYNGVRRLEPGGWVALDPHGFRERRYWRPRFREPPGHAEHETAAHVRGALGVAVKRRLSPDGPTGVLLSAGLDSSAVAASASAASPGSITAYSGVFPDHPAVDESELVSQLHHALALPAVTAEVRAGGLLASALESQEAWGAPLLSWGDFWTLPLMRHAASTGVKVMLGGDGGDELFAARSYLTADELRAGHPHRAFRLVRQLPGAAMRPPVGQVIRVAGNLALLGALPYELHRLLRRPLATRSYPAWLSARTARELVESEDPLAWKRLDGPRWWARGAHVLTRGVEELGVFEALRRAAMLAGLEARHPLFDLDLVELVLSSAPTASLNPHIDRPLLRASMAGMLPENIRMRGRKALFDPLLGDSLLGSDSRCIRAVLSNPKAELGAHLDLPAARRMLLNSPPGGLGASFQRTHYLWRLFTAECWLQAENGTDEKSFIANLTTSPARVRLRASARQPAS